MRALIRGKDMRIFGLRPTIFILLGLLTACGGGGGGGESAPVTVLGEAPAIDDATPALPPADDAPAAEPPAAEPPADDGPASGDGPDVLVDDEAVDVAPPPPTAEPPAPSAAGFAGTWRGTFSGDSQGTWQGTITADGRVSGSGSGTYGPFTFVGTVSDAGDLRFETSGSVSDGTVFVGQITRDGRISGRWTDSFDDGTFTGSLVEPASTPTLAGDGQAAAARTVVPAVLDHAGFGLWIEANAPALLLAAEPRDLVDRISAALRRPTAAAAMPSDGVARYRGDVAAVEHAAGGPLGTLLGEIGAVADFGAGRLSASAMLADAEDGTPWGRIELGPLAITAAGFAGGALSTNGHTGETAGRFVGPEARGLAGIFSLDGATTVNGAFLAAGDR